MQDVIDKLKGKGFDNERFERWLEESFVKRTYDTAALKAIWYGDQIIEEEKEILSELEDLNKDELEDYAMKTWGIDLDKRFKKETMIEEIKENLNKEE